MVATELAGPGIVPVYACLVALAAGASVTLRKSLQGTDEPPDTFTPALQPIEIAYLVGGVPAAIQAAVASVRHRASARGDAAAHRLHTLHDTLTHDTPPMERALYSLVAKHGGSVERARREASSVLRPVRSRLAWLKLVASESSVRRVEILQALLFGALAAFGFAHIVAVLTGSRPGRHSDFFVYCLLASIVWLAGRARPRPPVRSRRGDGVLEHLRTKNIALLWRLREQPHRLPANDFALAVALYGEQAVGMAYAAYGRALTPRRPSRGDWGVDASGTWSSTDVGSSADVWWDTSSDVSSGDDSGGGGDGSGSSD